MRVMSCLVLATAIAMAQSEPRKLPATVTAPITLPREEFLLEIDLRSFRVQRLANALVITNNNKIFRQYNPLSGDAEATMRLITELGAYRWGVLGQSRVVVEYGLTVGGAGELTVPRTTGNPQTKQAIDLRTLRAEQVQGVWCVRDNLLIHANFGLEQQEAEQMVAVCRKYGFNRLGSVGNGAVRYLYVGNEETPPVPLIPDNRLQRTGVEIPGHGFAGEKILLDPRKIELRNDRGNVTLRHGQDLLAGFGGDEWLARDALRVLQEAKLNEFCQIGDLKFFLQDGKPPAKAPMLARTTRFDPNGLKLTQQNGQLMIVDGGGKLFLPVTSEENGTKAIAAIKAFGFDSYATVGHVPSRQLKYYLKTR